MGVGKIDDFNDSNGILQGERIVNISGNDTVLISVYGDLEKLFLWDTEADTITQVTYNIGAVSEIVSDPENDTITVSVNVNKSDWIYMEVIDEYPDVSDLIVETSDGRVISSDMIWRENGKIYVLDDPDTTYNFTYNYTILPPTFDPENGATFNTGKPTITITYNETMTVIEATLNGETIGLTTTNNQIFTYTPTSNLANDDYILRVTVNDSDSNTRTDSFIFTISVAGQAPEDEGFPLWIAALFVIGIIIVTVLSLIYYKRYY